MKIHRSDPDTQPTPEAKRQAATVVMWFVLSLGMGTIAGIWIKLFLLGWVLAR